MIKHARTTVYIGAAFALVASLLAALGYGTYDAETRTFDLHPIQIEAAAGIIAGIVAPVLAAAANIFGWGQK